MKRWLAIIVMVVSLSVAILFASGGCATFQTVKEPVKVEMVLLNDLTFHGEVSGIKVPAQFGDFSITHYLASGTQVADMVELTFLPNSVGNLMAVILHVKLKCPEGIALQVYDGYVEDTTYWIYDAEGQAWQVDKEKYDYFIALDHPCVTDMPKDIDATLSI